MKSILIVLAALALAIPARAQLSGSTLQVTETATFGLAPDPGSFEWRDNGILISKGVFGNGTLQLSDQGAGTRLLWYPGKAAFRAGRVTYGTKWDEANIGTDSIAIGLNSQASASESIAFGCATATGLSSFATAGGAGLPNTASGWASVSMGGLSNLASGSASVAIGGYGNISSGGYTFSTGTSNTASGASSSAFGSGNRAESYHSFVIGRYNVGGYAPTGNTTWIATDPIFEIGNGGQSYPIIRSNALTVYKNGNATFQGVVRVAPGGDIPMYTGN